MPITFNAPPAPSPTPERSKTNAGSGGSEAEAGPVDAFANILQAAGAPKGDGATVSGEAAAHVDAAALAPAASDTAQASPAMLSGHRLTRLYQGRDPLRDFLSDPGRAPISPAPTGRAIALPGTEDAAVAGVAAQASKPLRRGKSDEDATALLGGNAVLAAASAAALAAGAAGPQAPSADAAPTAESEGGDSEVVRASLASGASEKSVRAEKLLATRADDQARGPSTGETALKQPLSFSADALVRVQGSQEKIAGANEFSNKLAEVAAPALPGAAPAAMPTATPVLSVDTPVGAAGWQAEFAGKLSQVVFMRSDSAEFHLHPAELGPVDVQISFAADQAVILITAPHAASRDALEQALPHLREMLADQGISLGQASVQGESRQPSAQADAKPGQNSGGGETPLAQAVVAAARVVHMRGLVDTFA